MFTQNSKLKKDNILGFGLPPIETCPGAGACKSICYACKGNFKRFPSVARALRANLAKTQSPSFVADVVAYLSKKRTVRAVRWNTSGDVYSQEYLDKLTKIAKLLPNIRFYLYTKSLHLDWRAFDILENACRIQSVGGQYDARIDPGRPVAIVVDTLPPLQSFEADGSQSDMVAAYAIENGKRFIYLVKH